MNRNILKNYAPQARRDFIQAVTDRASYFGLTKKKTEPVTVEGDVALIAGRAFPKKVAEQRKRLEERIARQGFDQVMEALAYTWFNRLVAIRFMELHGYLEHGYRVLSAVGSGQWAVGSENKNTADRRLPTADFPEILKHAEHVDLPGLDTQKVIDLKLAGDKEAELYRMLLIAQCNALHTAMPFLFERIDDETELLLPNNLLHSDSLIRTLVAAISEEDWREVEIIGWLYQFYISEKKDEVIGKVVKSEDIPAATQLFTPNWIVKYLVQNSLGRMWLEHHPDSPLKAKMEYYIEPAEQTPEVQAQLQEIIRKRATDQHGSNTDEDPLSSSSDDPCSIRVPSVADLSLNPEKLTLLDPACGSGHILVEAYDLLKAIYQERGYRAKDIPRLILEKNLYGLEIDDRAAQLAAFALMMKARADDRNLFKRGVQPNVLSIQESKGLDAADVTDVLNHPLEDGSVGNISQADVAHLIELFEHGKTFGSLIQVPASLAVNLRSLLQRVKDVAANGGLFEQGEARSIMPLISQALLLKRRYEAVIANPPYLGRKAMNAIFKEFAKCEYPDTRSDTFAMFIKRILTLNTPFGNAGIVAPFVWMSISSHESLRRMLNTQRSVSNLVKPSHTSFFDSAIVSLVAFVVTNSIENLRGVYIDLGHLGSADSQPGMLKEAIRDLKCDYRYVASAVEFEKIPGLPIAFSVSDGVRQIFQEGVPLGTVAEPRQGMATGSNDLFVRFWPEVSFDAVGLDFTSRQQALESKKIWFPYNKGGEFRKWYGNLDNVVNWQNDGHDIRHFTDENGKLRSRPQNVEFFFRPSITWSFVNFSFFGVRVADRGSLFDVGGSSAFPPDDVRHVIAGFLCSKVAYVLMKILNPTQNFQVGNVAALPFVEARVEPEKEQVAAIVKEAVQLARQDWDSAETSWAFSGHPVCVIGASDALLENSLEKWHSEAEQRRQRMRNLEESNNRIFITAYNLQNELSPEVSDDEVTLYVPNREEDIQRLISYSIGCMMGRYSLDNPGLIYAHCGGEGFDPSQYKTFPADEDGIIPIAEFEWFEDDAANRLERFVATAWPSEHLQENLKFIADSLGPNRGERPRETIRRYLATGFFKHHLSLYKKRPIYWLFSSGKQRAFQCLVYLHRYNAGTLSRMRTEYVIPLSGKINARIDQLEGDIAAASSTSHQKKLSKERDKLIKQREELQTFDEKLRHYADQRITLDLDDGVKVNYGKFGDLLAEAKAVTGQKPKA